MIKTSKVLSMCYGITIYQEIGNLLILFSNSGKKHNSTKKWRGTSKASGVALEGAFLRSECQNYEGKSVFSDLEIFKNRN